MELNLTFPLALSAWEIIISHLQLWIVWMNKFPLPVHRTRLPPRSRCLVLWKGQFPLSEQHPNTFATEEYMSSEFITLSPKMCLSISEAIEDEPKFSHQNFPSKTFQPLKFQSMNFKIW